MTAVKMNAEELIQAYTAFKDSKYLSDEYLKTHCNNYNTREDDWNLLAEYEYGQVHLRDDGVDVLIAEIRRLEKLCMEHGIDMSMKMKGE